jgi:hypothetical protein
MGGGGGGGMKNPNHRADPMSCREIMSYGGVTDGMLYEGAETPHQNPFVVTSSPSPLPLRAPQGSSPT